MKKNITFSLVILHSIHLYANISGVVYEDLPINGNNLNTYGFRDANELGVKNILIKAYPEELNTTSDENGRWTLATTQDSRIEFLNIPDYLKESPQSTSVQFIKNGEINTTFALHNPKDYSSTVNPKYVSSLQQNGSHIGSQQQSLQTVHYTATGLNSDFHAFTGEPGTGESPIDSITTDDIGATWAKAYQKNKQRLFVASALRRHMGLSNEEASIYVVDYSIGLESNLQGSFSIQGKTPNNDFTQTIDLGHVNRNASRDYMLDDDPLAPNIDLDAYDKVGKISYGGMDIDYINNRLWLINLNQKGLISINVSGDYTSLSTADVNQYLIQNLANVPLCLNGELRPWALKIHKGRGYIGAVCDASITKSQNDLSAHIFSFDIYNPQDGFKKEINFDLNYTRQFKGWHAWEETVVDINKTHFNAIYDEPILSDIEFDKNNDMFIAFLDRYAIQLGTFNYPAISGTTKADEVGRNFGEILKICNVHGVYFKEGSNECSRTNYTDFYNSNIHEFFNDFGGGNELEGSLGALALLKGSGQLLHTTLDPHPEEDTLKGGKKQYWDTQGVHTLNLENGSIENWYAFAFTKGNGFNFKANGLGDIELITDAAPIEIGDRIWIDQNANGIQDSNETGIKDVLINLICNNNIVASAKTDENGTYIFSNDSSRNSNHNEAYQYNITELTENTNECMLRIPNISQQVSLKNTFLTIANIGEGSNAHKNDSDGVYYADNIDLNITNTDIPIAGANNHSFDFGFTLLPIYSLGDKVWLDSNKDGIQNENESGIDGIKVNLYENAQCTGNIKQSLNTHDGGIYLFHNLPADTYCIKFIVPNRYHITTKDQGFDNNNSDVGNNGKITNIVLNNNNRDKDMGLYLINGEVPTPPIVNNSQTYILGDRVWLDSNHNGIQENNESGIDNITVNLYRNNKCTGIKYLTTSTQNGGLYQFHNLSARAYCIEFLNLPENYTITTANQGIEENNSDANSNAQITNIQLIQTNLNEDMGIYPLPIVDAVTRTSCSEMHLEDDESNANTNNPSTIIDVLNNDTGNKNQQTIKFLNITDGKILWEEERNPTTEQLLDTLTVKNEGIWSIKNNQVIFTAYNSFNGQIPTPVYYVILGENCTIKTQFSNVAQITIISPCTCPDYTENSVRISLFYILFITLITSFIVIRKEDF